MAVSAAYPDPVFDATTPVSFDFTSPCPETVSWKIVTVAHRVLAQGHRNVLGVRTLAWDQRDLKGRLVSDGLVYLVVAETGFPDQVEKILLLR